jgi:hypothetical protein
MKASKTLTILPRRELIPEEGGRMWGHVEGG